VRPLVVAILASFITTVSMTHAAAQSTCGTPAQCEAARQQAQRERQQQAERERERQAERERQQQAQRERQEQAERERERQAERERQQQAQRERQQQVERERQQQVEREREQQAERERQQQAERERQQQAEREKAQRPPQPRADAPARVVPQPPAAGVVRQPPAKPDLKAVSPAPTQTGTRTNAATPETRGLAVDAATAHESIGSASIPTPVSPRPAVSAATAAPAMSYGVGAVPQPPEHPSTMAQCNNFESALQVVRTRLAAEHQSCLDGMGRRHAPADNPPNGCTWSACAPYHDSSSFGQKQVDDCRATVSKYQKQQADAHQLELDRQRKAEEAAAAERERLAADAQRRLDVQTKQQQQLAADRASQQAQRAAADQHRLQQMQQQLEAARQSAAAIAERRQQAVADVQNRADQATKNLAEQQQRLDQLLAGWLQNNTRALSDEGPAKDANRVAGDAVPTSVGPPTTSNAGTGPIPPDPPAQPTPAAKVVALLAGLMPSADSGDTNRLATTDRDRDLVNVPSDPAASSATTALPANPSDVTKDALSRIQQWQALNQFVMASKVLQPVWDVTSTVADPDVTPLGMYEKAKAVYEFTNEDWEGLAKDVSQISTNARSEAILVAEDALWELENGPKTEAKAAEIAYWKRMVATLRQ
jgi:membrane protein involved in colicin uptake